MVKFEEAAEAFFDHERIQHKNPNSIKRKQSEMKWLSSWLEKKGIADLATVTDQDLVSLLAYLKNEHGFAAASLANAASMLRTFFRFLWQMQIISVDPAKALPGPKRKYGLPKPVLTHDEVKTLLDSLQPTTKRNLRDRAILELMYSSGLRRTEVHLLDLTDIDLLHRKVYVREGKGLKDRVVPMGKTAGVWLERYLQEARPKFKPDGEEQAIFLATGGGRICAPAVGQIVVAACKRAGIERRITAHCLRHTAASHLMWAGAKLEEVAEFLGHASIHVTAGYCRVGKWGVWKKEDGNGEG